MTWILGNHPRLNENCVHQAKSTSKNFKDPAWRLNLRLYTHSPQSKPQVQTPPNPTVPQKTVSILWLLLRMWLSKYKGRGRKCKRKSDKKWCIAESKLPNLQKNNNFDRNIWELFVDIYYFLLCFNKLFNTESFSMGNIKKSRFISFYPTHISKSLISFKFHILLLRI